MAVAEVSRPGPNVDFWPASSLQAWQAAPLQSFTDWLASQRVLRVQHLRETSCETYTAIFSSWLKSLEQRRVGLLEATPADAERFLEEKLQANRLDPVSRRRYLQLLDKVYRHLLLLGWQGPNPMQPELEKERLLEIQLPPGLGEAEVAQLTNYLGGLIGWKGCRDRALAAMLAGAGLRVNELLLLTSAEISESFDVKVQPEGVHRAHTTLVLPDGPWRGWLGEWQAQRVQMGIPGLILFPATSKGSSFSPSGLFRRVKGWLEGAQLQAAQMGPNLLRNTFGRSAISCGRYNMEQVQEFLGHEEIRATERYQ